MTVGMLIDELKKYNQDAHVIVDVISFESATSEFIVFSDCANSDFVYLIEDDRQCDCFVLSEDEEVMS